MFQIISYPKGHKTHVANTYRGEAREQVDLYPLRIYTKNMHISSLKG